ncbi:SKU5 similar 13 [Zea mays]|uniref:SKU5 similar 13 n=1 Tax=Zea mays TaxID=4577 RepID=A0A1D6N8K1_MAIZE|nr:SKU5 similar 13 [Zea mays]
MAGRHAGHHVPNPAQHQLHVPLAAQGPDRQLYVSVISPERSLRDEYNMPETSLRCGKVVGLPMPPSYLSV